MSTNVRLLNYLPRLETFRTMLSWVSSSMGSRRKSGLRSNSWIPDLLTMRCESQSRLKESCDPTPHENQILPPLLPRKRRHSSPPLRPPSIRLILDPKIAPVNLQLTKPLKCEGSQIKNCNRKEKREFVTDVMKNGIWGIVAKRKS